MYENGPIIHSATRSIRGHNGSPTLYLKDIIWMKTTEYLEKGSRTEKNMCIVYTTSSREQSRPDVKREPNRHHRLTIKIASCVGTYAMELWLENYVQKP